LKKVFVDTGGDPKNRKHILKEIESAKLGLDSEEGAVGHQRGLAVLLSLFPYFVTMNA
jgi:hypothetical protein